MFSRGPIIAIGVVAVALLGAPFGLGMLAESSVRQQLTEMDDYPPLSLEITEYNRGWFGSRMVVEVTPGQLYYDTMAVNNPMMAGILDQIVAPFVVEFAHGPILTLNGFAVGSFAMKAGLDPEAAWVADGIDTLGIPYLIEMRGTAGFLSGFSFEGDVPAFDVDEQGNTLSFSGLDFSGHTNGSEVSFDAASERLALQSLLLSFTLDGLSANGEYTFRPDQVALGEAEIGIDRFALSQPLQGTGDSVAVDELTLYVYGRENDSGNIDSGFVYAAAGLQAQDTPQFTDMAIGLNLLNVDGAAMQALSDTISDAAGASDPALLAFSILPMLDDVLATSPTISLDPIRFTMDGGQFDANFSLMIDADTMPPIDANLMMDPSGAIAAISAELNLTATKMLMNEIVAFSLAQQMPTQGAASDPQMDAMIAQQAEQTIQLLVLQGMLVDDGDNYSTQVTFSNGTATVNGNALPLGSLGLF